MILHWKFHQKDHPHEFHVVNNAHLYRLFDKKRLNP
jgi:hypothetical protein